MSVAWILVAGLLFILVLFYKAIKDKNEMIVAERGRSIAIDDLPYGEYRIDGRVVSQINGHIFYYHLVRNLLFTNEDGHNRYYCVRAPEPLTGDYFEKAPHVCSYSIRVWGCPVLQDVAVLEAVEESDDV